MVSVEGLGMEMIQLEQMSLAFIVTHSQELAFVTEASAEGILQHSWCNTREITEHCVGWYVSKPKSILLPLRAEGKYF